MLHASSSVAVESEKISQFASVVYVLKLVRCKWFVGHCLRHDLPRRLRDEAGGRGHAWVRIHPAVALDSLYEGGLAVANEVTRWLADAAGWPNVRGGDWSAWKLGYKPKDYRPKLMRYLRPSHAELGVEDLDLPSGPFPLDAATKAANARLRAEYEAWVLTLRPSLQAALADVPRE